MDSELLENMGHVVSILSLETMANVSEAPPQARSYARCFIWRMNPH